MTHSKESAQREEKAQWLSESNVLNERWQMNEQNECVSSWFAARLSRVPLLVVQGSNHFSARGPAGAVKH